MICAPCMVPTTFWLVTGDKVRLGAFDSLLAIINIEFAIFLMAWRPRLPRNINLEIISLFSIMRRQESSCKKFSKNFNKLNTLKASERKFQPFPIGG